MYLNCTSYERFLLSVYFVKAVAVRIAHDMLRGYATNAYRLLFKLMGTSCSKCSINRYSTETSA